MSVSVDLYDNFYLFILILIKQHIKRLRRTVGHHERQINQDHYAEQINCDLNFFFHSG